MWLNQAESVIKFSTINCRIINHVKIQSIMDVLIGILFTVKGQFKLFGVLGISYFDSVFGRHPLELDWSTF